MFAAKKWLLLLLILAAAVFGGVSVDAVTLPQTCVGGYQLFDAASRLAPSSQVLELQRGIAFAWYDTASECSVAAKSTLPSKLYSYTDDATAALVEKSQLGLPGRTTYLTPNGNLTPLQAQIELALPQKNTATALFEVSTEGLDASKVLLQRRVTGNVFNRGGGGTEILFDGTIPLENLNRIR